MAGDSFLVSIFNIIPDIFSLVFIVLLIRELFGIGYGDKSPSNTNTGGTGGTGGAGGSKVFDWFKKRKQAKNEEREEKRKTAQEKIDAHEKKMHEAGNLIGTLEVNESNLIKRIVELIDKLAQTINNPKYKELVSITRGGKEHPMYRDVITGIKTHIAEVLDKDSKKFKSIYTTIVKEINKLDAESKKLFESINYDIELIEDEKLKIELIEKQKELYEKVMVYVAEKNNSLGVGKDIGVKLTTLSSKLLDSVKNLISNMNNPTKKGTYESKIEQLSNELIELERVISQYTVDKKEWLAKLEKLQNELSVFSKKVAQIVKSKVIHENPTKNTEGEGAESTNNLNTEEIVKEKEKIKKKYPSLKKEINSMPKLLPAKGETTITKGQLEKIKEVQKSVIDLYRKQGALLNSIKENYIIALDLPKNLKIKDLNKFNITSVESPQQLNLYARSFLELCESELVKLSESDDPDLEITNKINLCSKIIKDLKSLIEVNDSIIKEIEDLKSLE